MNSLLRQFALWLLRGLEESLDPDLKARLEQYRRDREATEKRIADEQKLVADAYARLAQLKDERAAVAVHIGAVEKEIADLKDEVKRIDAEPGQNSELGDGDVLRSRL